MLSRRGETEQCRQPQHLCAARLCRVHQLTLSKLHLQPKLNWAESVRESKRSSVRALDERAAQRKSVQLELAPV